MRCSPAAVLLLICVCSQAAAAEPAFWPQFRGPQCAGIADATANPPVELTDTALLWKTPVPKGHGSPCIWDKQLLISGFDTDTRTFKLLSIDRVTGQVQWQREVVAEAVENVHEISSPATATIATDGERVYAYCASIGLLCFDMDGQPQWECRLPVPQVRFGSGTSPIVAGEQVILNRDAEKDAFLLALDRKRGHEVWRTPLPASLFLGSTSYATPVIWNEHVVLHRSGEVSAYRLDTGERTWWYSIAGSGTSTPVLGNDCLFVNAWNNLGEPDLRVDLPGFGDLIKQHDKDGDGKLDKAEFPDDLALARRPEVGDDVPGAQFWMKPFFDQLDANKDNHLTRFEWLAVKLMISTMASEHGIAAIRAGGSGDVTKTHEAWKEKRGIGEVPSLLVHDNRVYMLKDGGIVTCMDAKDGRVIYRERVGEASAYYASPVLAAGRIYIASSSGTITVFQAGDKPTVLAKAVLEEPIHASPAVLDNCLFLRTEKNVLAFARK